MIRTIFRNLALVATLGVGLAATSAQAAFVGSFGVNAISPSINAPGLGAATTFTIASMTGNGNTGGGFTGLVTPTTTFTGGSFTLGQSTGFTFADGGTVGGFTETAAPVLTSVGIVNGVVTSEAFYILGTYVGGPVGTSPVAASFTVSFTQNGGPTTSVSASGTLNIPPLGSVPEPASVAMLGLGLAGVGAYSLRRRNAK